MTDRAALRALLRANAPAVPPAVGRLTAASSSTLRASLPDAAMGAVVTVERATAELLAEVVGFEGDDVILLPWEDATGVRPGAPVRLSALGAHAPDAAAALGAVLDPFGRRLDDGPDVPTGAHPLRAPPPEPLRRGRVHRPLETGVRVLDGLLPLGQGQRVGLFAGSGVGKSMLLGQLTRGVDADACVVALVGERGREVGEFLDELDALGSRVRTTVVVATSDAPPLARIRAAHLATAIAEDWRDRGAHCLLLVDSVTRYARALREAALAAGEKPARRGYPASVFAALPVLLERAGPGATGAISAIYSVLVDGGDLEEPVSDEVRGILDGHVVLSRSLAERGHFPAVDVLRSVSRVATRVTDAEHADAMLRIRDAMAALERQRDAIELGIYQRGTDPRIDAALDVEERLLAFLRQRPDEFTPAPDAIGELLDIVADLP
jgi:FliI/YscN family ATPase